MKISCRAAMAGALVACAGGVVRADNIISNLLAPDSSSTLFGTGSSTVYKAAGFRIPFYSTYIFDAATLKMDFDEPTPGDARVSLWRGTGTPQVEIVELFGGPEVGVGSFTFVSPMAVQLDPGETYWLRVEAASGNTGAFRWITTATAPSGELMNAGYVFNDNPSSFFNKYRIDGVLQRMCINFTTLPGPDGMHGTLDDVLNAAPPTFGQQNSQLTGEFAFHDIEFLGNADNRNEVLSDALLGGNAGSSPNVLASEGPQIIEVRFNRPVYGIECVFGQGAADGDDRLALFDSGGGTIASFTGQNVPMSHLGNTEIVTLRVSAQGAGAFAALDDLCVIFEPPPPCPADLTGGSDPNDPSYGVPDGVLDAADFFYYLDQFVAQNAFVADLTGSSDPNDPSYGVPDGVLDAADFFFYLDLFVEGCP
ncbi:MAG: hypothetical protein IT439_02580 [Phycisphaerales bacterium]|nr:hypothetical protein [Phycisphaerales bacterium]